MRLSTTSSPGRGKVCGPPYASRPRARLAGAEKTRCMPRRAWKCCTTHFWFTTTSRTEAIPGKEIDGDLWEGKRTLLLTHARAHASLSDREWLAGFLERPRERRLPREVSRLRKIIEDAGS